MTMGYRLEFLCSGFSVCFVLEQLKKKLDQLEEQLDHEMQAKDELEQKCKYERTRRHVTPYPVLSETTTSMKYSRLNLKSHSDYL